MENKIIGYIENGIVIDHIPAGAVWKVARLLNIDRENQKGRVSLGDYFESSKMGKKGVLKIEGVMLSEDILNLIALVAENANVSIISDGKVIDKHKARIPNILKKAVLCSNVNCITNDKKEDIDSLLEYSKENGFCCYYCGKCFKKHELREDLINI